eukprot:scaffold1137_cov392-Pavlova_lutheri.AAC.10
MGIFDFQQHKKLIAKSPSKLGSMFGWFLFLNGRSTLKRTAFIMVNGGRARSSKESTKMLD